MSINIIIIILTAIISIIAFRNTHLLEELLLWPQKMKGKPEQFYRLLTAGFVHADYTHLGFNMFTLYFFGEILADKLHGIGPSYFLLLYLTGIIISCIPSYIRHQNNAAYRSLGASGGVAAVVFAMIYLYPWEKIYIFFIPIGIPCVLYAIVYLIYTIYMSRSGKGIVNHDAHLWGSVYGLLFMVAIDPTHGAYFIQQISQWRF